MQNIPCFHMFSNSWINLGWVKLFDFKMTLKTCLLVTDDPDDHQAFSEAISEIAEEAIVLVVLDSQKALELLKSKTHLPHYIFLDLSMYGIRINSILSILREDPHLHAIQAIVYGEAQNFDRIENRKELTFFNKEYEYSELQKFLRTLFSLDNE